MHRLDSTVLLGVMYSPGKRSPLLLLALVNRRSMTRTHWMSTRLPIGSGTLDLLILSSEARPKAKKGGSNSISDVMGGSQKIVEFVSVPLGLLRTHSLVVFVRTGPMSEQSMRYCSGASLHCTSTARVGKGLQVQFPVEHSKGGLGMVAVLNEKNSL